MPSGRAAIREVSNRHSCGHGRVVNASGLVGVRIGGKYYVDALQPRRIRERWVSGRVCGPAEGPGPRAQSSWGREGGRRPQMDRRRRRRPPHAADARDAARGLWYPAAQMQASRMGPLCWPPVGDCIPFWDSHRPGWPPTHCTVAADVQNDPDDISHADAGADADADAHWSCWHISSHEVRSGLIYTTARRASKQAQASRGRGWIHDAQASLPSSHSSTVQLMDGWADGRMGGLVGPIRGNLSYLYLCVIFTPRRRTVRSSDCATVNMLRRV